MKNNYISIFTFCLVSVFLQAQTDVNYEFNNSKDFDIFSVLSDSALNAEDKLVRSQIHNDIRNLVEELPEDQRTVLKLRMYNDMSFKEISENTSVSINTALGRMRYALINLRKLIEENNVILTN